MGLSVGTRVSGGKAELVRPKAIRRQSSSGREAELERARATSARGGGVELARPRVAGMRSSSGGEGRSLSEREREMETGEREIKRNLFLFQSVTLSPKSLIHYLP